MTTAGPPSPIGGGPTQPTGEMREDSGYGGHALGWAR